MASLKLFLPQLAAVLQVNPHTLYERQRVLMREGLLPVVPGRGPGSGVHVSPKSVAALLVSILATDALTQAGADTRKLARAKQNENRCPLTGETRFQNALERLLSSESLAESTLRIEVERMGLTARIGFKSADDRLVISEFGGK